MLHQGDSSQPKSTPQAAPINARPPTSRSHSKLVVLALLACVAVVALMNYLAEDEDELPRSRRAQSGSIRFGPSMQGIFRHQGTGNEMRDWTEWIDEARAQIPPYPEGRFRGRGIVMALTFELKYFSCLYINLRVIRESVKCTLPIEVLYTSHTPVPAEIVRFLESSFHDVTLVDIRTVNGVPEVDLNGYQIKAFSVLFSSFEEILFLDTDNMPLVDPSLVFNLKQYKSTGALFWPDYCNMHANVIEAWDIFRQPRPPVWLGWHNAYQMPPNSTTGWPPECDSRKPLEVLGGEIVIDKRRVWKGLVMTVFINRHHAFFMKRIFRGDKQTFSFGFNTTDTPYSLAAKNPFGIGIGLEIAGEFVLSANTMGQRHPVTGEVLFMHRNAAKLSWTYDYLRFDVVPRAWEFMARQNPHSPWVFVERAKYLPELFVTDKMDLGFNPKGPEAVIVPVPKVVRKLEDDCIEYMHALEKLPFYPSSPADCSFSSKDPKAFLCSTI